MKSQLLEGIIRKHKSTVDNGRGHKSKRWMEKGKQDVWDGGPASLLRLTTPVTCYTEYVS